jgi:iron complex transport system ATP-binding protein
MYADRVLVMKSGRVAASGSPREVIENQLIAKVFDCDLKVGVLPAGGIPFVLPQSVAL